MIVIIDNHDSFTYNLVHYLEQIAGDVRVFQNDEITGTEIRKMAPELIVLSPGPGRPAETGATREVLATLSGETPILGVCLGHQAIVEFFGGRIVKGEQPMHGKTAAMSHDGRGLFDGIESPAQITRYHSLVAEKASMPACLEVSCETSDGAIMGVRHRQLPVAGIQFHPESIMTTEGYKMLENYYKQARFWNTVKKGDANGQSVSSL
ncbi:anthranilate synthase component II [Planococcus beigongshangi]|uniref:anthranilate synthase component II n=1 Tax=Planococcus beigongshangi TaxID=2782536 RepID=UPI00193B94A8|nr:aminodeoxychorismate/anthranilate synthase component II [Planococcus beigongshangi]